MLVSFNPYRSSNKNNKQSPNFKSLQNGIIEAAEVAKNATVAERCAIAIYHEAYKPTAQNLEALFAAKVAANDNISNRVAILPELDYAIALLIKKAQDKGQQTYDSLKGLIQKAKDQGIDLSLKQYQ